MGAPDDLVLLRMWNCYDKTEYYEKKQDDWGEGGWLERALAYVHML